MLFNSLHFLLFFPIVVAVQLCLPHRLQIVWLLLASCYFYMALIPAYILVLFVLILIDYVAGIWIERSKGKSRRHWLVASLVANISVLGFFKYFNFLNANASVVAHWFGIPYAIPALTYVLPIGLSFHTFQSMAYTIEVYRGNQKAERDLLKYALYVLFWPQLVAGPIERPRHLLPQFGSAKRFDYDSFVSGLRLMLIGFFKKVLIADRLAEVVNTVYGNPSGHSGTALILATYAFTFQIYYDFSGYSDIALGAARVSGFDLMVNFRMPYLATSIPEFWRRWHISLSTWFRDYLYFPLGGNRTSRWRHCLNLMIVFVVSGFWHGAQWTFLIWGALHGSYLVLSVLTGRWRASMSAALGLSRFPRLLHALKLVLTFHLVAFAWIFFRANSLSDAALIVRTIVSTGLSAASGLHATLNFTIAASGIALLALLYRALQRRARLGNGQDPLVFPLAFRSQFARWAAYYTLILSILVFGKMYAHQGFIYFQF